MKNNQNNPSQAWSNFAATGSVDAYLRYKQAVNQSTAATEANHAPANKSTGASRGSVRRKRQAGNGTF